MTMTYLAYPERTWLNR